MQQQITKYIRDRIHIFISVVIYSSSITFLIHNGLFAVFVHIHQNVNENTTWMIYPVG